MTDWDSITVKENKQEMKVFYPKSEDKSEEHDLRQYAEQSTREQLRKRAPKRIPTAEDKKRASEVLREHQERREYKRNNINRKFF